MPDSVRSPLLVIVSIILFLPAVGVSQPVVEKDRKRIQTHLKRVEQKLRARDVSHLTPAEQRARERNLDRLHAYWKRGVFPHNTETDNRTPIFIDDDGRDCAVAHLMRESGWRREARSIAEDENLKRLPNMESPEVQAWVEESGLTADEATMIQPSYSPCRQCNCEANPVCGSNGETYVNKCTAEKCANVSSTQVGCCSVGDDPIVPRETDDPYGKRCSNDPTPPGDASSGGDTGDRRDTGTALCPNATWTPDASNGGDGDTGSPSEPACTVAPSGAPVIPIGAVLVLGWLGFIRRRR